MRLEEYREKGLGGLFDESGSEPGYSLKEIIALNDDRSLPCKERCEFVNALIEEVEDYLCDIMMEEEKDDDGMSMVGIPVEGESNFEKEVRRNALIPLESISAAYGWVGTIHLNPTSCMTEIHPRKGISPSSIKADSEKIAAAMGVDPASTRIYIKGNNVAVEIPRAFPEGLDFWDSLECQDAIDCKGLPLALGADYFTRNVIEDLTECQDILIAGASRQGKSNCIRSMIDSILYFNGPDRIQFAMFDPTGSEFSVYNGLRKDYFFGGGVISDEDRAMQMLRDLHEETESRRRMLTESHCRDINEFLENGGSLPYIALFIDEFAYLSLGENGKDFRKLINDLARKGRTAGIHCVIATGRPCSDVITGDIKVSFPCRIAFKVPSRVESMTVLDCTGAEKLLGPGDMLVMKGFDIRRIQGGLEDPENTEKLVAYVNGKHIAEDALKIL